MKVTVISVGKLKEAYFRDAVTAFQKALEKRHEVALIEVPDEKAPESLSDKEMAAIKAAEGVRILDKIETGAFVTALAIDGERLTDEKFERLLRLEGHRPMVFVIGGSLGLSDAVLNRAQKKISFGQATFPHQLMKVMLLEKLESSL